MILATITWRTTHELEPSKPLESDVKPMVIEVVSLDWKWLFIYPEQNIATVNMLRPGDANVSTLKRIRQHHERVLYPKQFVKRFTRCREW
ncbi:hypothetical protein O9992_15375 [Vibrio lentus]|nr:hypothetical protein [Vibrio lentus]